MFPMLVLFVCQLQTLLPCGAQLSECAYEAVCPQPSASVWAPKGVQRHPPLCCCAAAGWGADTEILHRYWYCLQAGSCSTNWKFIVTQEWTIPFNKDTPLYMTELFQCLFWDKTFAFAVPLGWTALYKELWTITEVCKRIKWYPRVPILLGVGGGGGVCGGGGGWVQLKGIPINFSIKVLGSQ